MDPTSTNPKDLSSLGNKEGDDGSAEHSIDPRKFKEQFEELKFPELEFQDKWTLWEQYESKHSSDYKKTMQKIACFNDPISFWRVWNSVPHADIMNQIHYFDDEKEETVSCFWKTPDGLMKISALSLFKTGIEPAWEDPVNKKGGDFSVKVHCTKEEIKPLWEDLILEVISSNFPCSDQICGMRLLDKPQMFKIELWVKYNNEIQKEEYTKQKSRLQDFFQSYDASIGYNYHG